MNHVVRLGRAEDHVVTVDLLMLAAGDLLVSIFGNGDESKTREFLHHAWQQGKGQYGYDHHYVIELEQAVKGVVTVWHNQLDVDFDRFTLSIITDFFGLDEALEIVKRSQFYCAALTPPGENEIALGHLAVSPDARGVGLAKALVDYCAMLAESLGKDRLVLDVTETNDHASHFYAANGFIKKMKMGPFYHMVKLLH